MSTIYKIGSGQPDHPTPDCPNRPVVTRAALVSVLGIAVVVLIAMLFWTVSIATDRDIELKATYIRTSDSLVFEGSITDTGNRPAPIVEVWCRMQGFAIVPVNSHLGDDRMEIASNAFCELRVDTFRNLKPGETRPIKIIVLCDKIQNVPQGWEVWSRREPMSAVLTPRVLRY